ncbi:MAG: zinc ribbon domain-containing protein [Oscillospiraceae bacterium]
MRCSKCNNNIPDDSEYCCYCFAAQSENPKTHTNESAVHGGSFHKAFIVAPVVLVFILDIILFIWSFSVVNQAEADFIFTSTYTPFLSILNCWEPVFSYVFMGLSLANILLWISMILFSRFLSIKNVNPAIYILNILISVGMLYIKTEFSVIFALPIWAIIITMFTLVKMQSIAHAVKRETIENSLLYGIFAAILDIVAWTVIGYWAWIILIFVTIIFHIIFLVILLDCHKIVKTRGISPIAKKEKSNKYTGLILSPSKNFCRKCGKEFPKESEFCPKCGTQKISLEIPKACVCPKCGEKAPADSDFCMKCGTKIVKPEKPQTKICPKCESEIPADSEFCTKCGGRVIHNAESISVVVCTSCSNEVNSSNGAFPRFCPKCGSRLYIPDVKAVVDESLKQQNLEEQRKRDELIENERNKEIEYESSNISSYFKKSLCQSIIPIGLILTVAALIFASVMMNVFSDFIQS